jgi:hypothetical protein
MPFKKVIALYAENHKKYLYKMQSQWLLKQVIQTASIRL